MTPTDIGSSWDHNERHYRFSRTQSSSMKDAKWENPTPRLESWSSAIAAAIGAIIVVWLSMVAIGHVPGWVDAFEQLWR